MNRISISLIIVVLLLATMMFTSCGEATEHVCSFDTKGEVVKATCVSYGYTEYTCECGEKVQKDIVDSSTAHKYVETARVEATCAYEGVITEACGICGHVKNTSIPTTSEHTVENWTELEAATCQRPGKKEGTCVICSETISEETNDHEFEIDLNFFASIDGWNIEIAPDCVNAGLKVAVCVCGEGKLTEEIPALGHDWEDATEENPDGWKITLEATCAYDGKMVRKCTTCGFDEGESYSDPENHVMVKGDDTRSQANCIRAGWVLWICEAHEKAADLGIATKNEKCNYVEYTDYVEAAHDFTILADESNIEIINPDCKNTGFKYVICNNPGCKEKLLLETIPSNGHSFADEIEEEGEIVVVDPTCSTPGYTVRTCTKCGESVKDTYVDPVDHEFVDAGWIKAPVGCGGTGIAKYECKYGCGEWEEREVTVDTHTEMKPVVIEAGEYTSGISALSCECGENYKFLNYIPAKNSSKVEASVHKYEIGEDKYNKAAVVVNILDNIKEGVVVIPCYIYVEDHAFYYHVEALDYSLFYGAQDVKEVYLPITIKHFYTAAFWYAESIDVIHYEGTVEQWNAITKELYWDRGMGEYTVDCADGVINQYGTVSYK